MKEGSETNMPAAAIQHHRWTRETYERMVEVGILGSDDALELLDGHIVDMSPQGSRHASIVEVVARRLATAFGSGYRVREEKPLALGDWSEPEPDIAVVQGREWDFVDAHPTTAALVVEVAESSLATDRGIKKSIYARAGIAEYWIVDVRGGVIEVYRDPVGNDYASRSVFGPGDILEPSAASGGALAVADLLPPSG